MLKLNLDPTFKSDVQITVPGAAKPVMVGFVFKYMTRDDFTAFIESQKKKKLVETLADVILGWEGFDAEFSKENLDTFFNNYPASPLEVWKKYNDDLFESRVKN